MPVTPTGELSARVDVVRTMLANCAAFQEFVGVDEEEEAPATVALDSIFVIAAYLEDVKEEGQPMSPHAIVTTGLNRSRAIAGGIATTFNTRGNVKVKLAGSVPSEHAGSHADAGYWFLNMVGAVLLQLRQQCGVGISEYVREVNLVGEAKRADDVEAKTFSDCYTAEIEVLTGLGND